jgi:tryptophan synthase alpha chain
MMAVASCSVLVEQLTLEKYRAFSPTFPDCEAVAATAEEARRLVELAIHHILQERELRFPGEAVFMNPIDALFQRLRSQKRKAFIAFLTAGDPSIEATEQFVPALARHGASLIEIGFPYSDPIADGPTVQASYTRALARGIRVDDVFRSIQRVRSHPALMEPVVPLVGMLSYALVHRRGPAQFLDQAHACGLSGAIVPDLPVDEADELLQLAAKKDFKIIQLVTPMTPRDRAVRIARASTGFLYYVSVAGITGERDRLPDELVSQLRWLRTQTDIPLCVGFGISKPEHARQLREVADGIIVGSALVRFLELAEKRPLPDIAEAMGKLVQTLSTALNP